MSQSFAFMVEVNDLTANVVWANIPDANVPESAVTQHEAALAILATQLSGVLDDARVQESNVTQHEAALTIQQTQVPVVSETAANLANIAASINTDAAKVAGYWVWDSTNNQPVWAVGSADGDVWVDGVGTTVHTPV